MEKLELKHLAPYFPYRLRGNARHDEYYDPVINKELYRIESGRTEKGRIDDPHLIVGDIEVMIEEFHPLLRPLSDLTKEIKHGGNKFSPMMVLQKCS